MPNFRLISSEIATDPEAAKLSRTVVWVGEQYPDAAIISDNLAALRSSRSGGARSPFSQRYEDVLLLQRQRSAKVLGWKTLQTINIFDSR